MTNAQLELDAAELNLARARAAAAEEQREADKAAYRAAKQEGRAVLAEYNAVMDQFFAASRELELRAIPLAVLTGAVREHINQHPELVEEFATDEAVAAWEARGQQLKAEHLQLVSGMNLVSATRERLRLEGVKLGQRLEHQRYVSRNLKNKIDDPGGQNSIRGWVGGVSGI